MICQTNLNRNMTRNCGNVGIKEKVPLPKLVALARGAANLGASSHRARGLIGRGWIGSSGDVENG